MVVVAAAVCEFVVAGFRVVAVSVAVAVRMLTWLFVGSVVAVMCIFVVWRGAALVRRTAVLGFRSCVDQPNWQLEVHSHPVRSLHYVALASASDSVDLLLLDRQLVAKSQVAGSWA